MFFQRVSNIEHRIGQREALMAVGRRAQGSILVLVALVSVLAACTSRSHSSTSSTASIAASVGADTAIVLADTRTTPQGWQRLSYGMLSVAVPAGWTVITVDPGNCGTAPAHTITELRTTQVSFSACGAEVATPGPLITDSARLECLVGKANHLFYGDPVLRVVDGYSLIGNRSLVYLQKAHAEGLVTIATSGATANPSDPGPTILASVEPTGRSC
jgi:hypothetical protein